MELLGLALCLLSSPVHAAETKTIVQLRGIGALTCSHWRSTAASRAEGTIWIYGFWSGLNYVAAVTEQGQVKSNEKEMITEIVRMCAINPSQVLASVVWGAYMNLSQR